MDNPPEYLSVDTEQGSKLPFSGGYKTFYGPEDKTETAPTTCPLPPLLTLSKSWGSNITEVRINLGSIRERLTKVNVYGDSIFVGGRGDEKK